MTIEQCYEMIGGEYTQVVKRLSSLRLVQRFIAKFLDDDSFQALQDAMKSGCRADAFRAAHTLKGVCANLGFGSLLSSVEKLTELLRPEAENIPKNAFLLMDEVKKNYELTVHAIRAYLDSVA